jgi:hypothetical protein
LVNHDTAWDANAHVKSLRDYGEDILRSIATHRNSEEVKPFADPAQLELKLKCHHFQERRRPIIVVAHSFGGNLIKKVCMLRSAFCSLNSLTLASPT